MLSMPHQVLGAWIGTMRQDWLIMASTKLNMTRGGIWGFAVGLLVENQFSTGVLEFDCAESRQKIT